MQVVAGCGQSDKDRVTEHLLQGVCLHCVLSSQPVPRGPAEPILGNPHSPLSLCRLSVLPSLHGSKQPVSNESSFVPSSIYGADRIASFKKTN